MRLLLLTISFAIGLGCTGPTISNDQNMSISDDSIHLSDNFTPFPVVDKKDPITKPTSNPSDSEYREQEVSAEKKSNEAISKDKNPMVPSLLSEDTISLEETKKDRKVEIEEPDITSSLKENEDLTTKPQDEQAKEIHTSWDELLKQYVSPSGKVDYAGLKKEIAKLNAYLKTLSDHPLDKSWSRNKQMAYLINAYNAFTVKLILDDYPISSIKKIHNGDPWKVKWIKLGEITYSLNAIENDILRPEYNDPRIHFAVNCAARSCPPLLNKAWTASNLENMLEKQTRKFINNPVYNKIEKSKVSISKIFEWYSSDFGGLVDFLNKYSDLKIDSNVEIKYMEYNWSLNE